MAGRLRVDEIANSVNASPLAPFGMRFPNTNQSGATVLDWYEEGTWTPRLDGHTTAGTGTYNNRTGYYTRIGNVVFVSIRLDIASHTGTGLMKVTLPFIPKVAVGGGHAFALSCNVSNLTFTPSTYLNGFTSTDSEAYVLIMGMANNTAYVTLSMDTSFIVVISGMYMVA